MTVHAPYTEQELTRGLAHGDTGAFSQLMRAHYPMLLDYAARLVRNSAQAEDIVEEAFIQVWKRHTSFASLDAVRKFLWMNIRHDCLDAIRHRDVRERHHEQIAQSAPREEDPAALQGIVRSEVLAEIHSAIRELPEKMQRVFIMSYVEGLKNPEIAIALDLSEQTVRNQKSRALEILRLQFRDKEQLLALLAWLVLSAK